MDQDNFLHTILSSDKIRSVFQNDAFLCIGGGGGGCIFLSTL